MPLKPINEYTAAEVGMWLTAQGLGDHVSKFLDAGVDGDVLVSLDVSDFMNDLGLSGLQAKKVMSNIEFSLDMVLGGSVKESGGGGGMGDNGENERRLCRQVRELQDEVRYKDEQISDLNKRLHESRMKEAQIQQQSQQPAAPVAYAYADPQQQQRQPAPYDQYHQSPPSYQPAPQSNYSSDPYQTAYTAQQQQQQQSPPANPYQTAPPPPPPHQPSKGAQVVGGAAKGAAGGAIKGAISELFSSRSFSLSPEIALLAWFRLSQIGKAIANVLLTLFDRRDSYTIFGKTLTTI
ncbi:hypothetical protein ACHAW5_001692 [Stephanodiscus triporus]|uniref:SAM domain-containing protein n=1 Tax=Stephanodiscus triporus TaxID=2934178 RepID=A0ABD3Q9G0_9STRA